VPVTTFQHDVPPEVDAMISRAIAKDPRDRYQSGADFACEMAQFRQTDRILAESTSFFARVVQKRHGIQRPSSKRKGFLDTYWFWSVVASCILVLFGWRLTHVYEQPIAPPSPPPIAMAPPLELVEQAAKHMKLRLSNPKPEIAAKSEPASGADAEIGKVNVQIEIQHHFTDAKASIWFDDDLLFDRPLRSADQRHPLLRAVEMNQVTAFQLAPGKHWLQVRIVSPDQAYDQIETIETDLEPGASHVLLVNCDKKKMLVAFK